MTLPRRKITLQLVPLLDLMLVILFLQFMELEEHAEQAVSSVAQERRALSAQRREAEQIAENAFAQRDLVGQLAAELFNLPDATIERLLKQRFPDDPLDADEIAAMQQEFRRLRGRHGQDVLKHLLTFREIRKRCDVWEVFVDRDVTTLKANGEESSFRTATTSQGFAAQLLARCRMLPQPKSLLLVVLSWGEPRLQVFNAVKDGFPQAIEKIQADNKNSSRVQSAIMGFDPQRKSPLE